MRLSSVVAVTAAALVAACSHKAPKVNPKAPEINPAEAKPKPVVNARVASTGRVASPPATKPADCTEAVRQAQSRPDLPVDRLPTPIVMRPTPLEQVPPAALRTDGSSEVKVAVIVDTLGRADMRTFTVVNASSPWLVENVRGAIGQWKFTPAQLGGCKVPRLYHFMAISHARKGQ